MKKLLILCGLIFLDPNQQFQNPNAPNTTQPWGQNYIPSFNRPWEKPNFNKDTDQDFIPNVIDEIIIRPLWEE